MIVQQIVEQSGGSINAFSDGLDKGTSFEFSMKIRVLELVKRDIAQANKLL